MRPFSLLVPLGKIFAGLLVALLVAQEAFAQNSGVTLDQDRWEFTVSPYLIIPWLDGEVAVGNFGSDIEIGPSEVFDNLQLAGMVYFSARKGRWGFAVDTLYLSMGTSTDRPPSDQEVDQALVTFMGTTRINQHFDFVFGARWSHLKVALDFKGPIGLQIEDRTNWVDPIVGIRFQHRLGKHFSFEFLGDLGGFGVGSRIAWNLEPVIAIDLASWAKLAFGYRVIGFDYRSGEGRARIVYEMNVQGPMMGVAFHF
jgi:hypothetical protein